MTATPTLDVEASWRFVHYGARTALDVSLQGGNLAHGAPCRRSSSSIAACRTASSSRCRRATRCRRTLRLSPSLAFETSAIARRRGQRRPPSTRPSSTPRSPSSGRRGTRHRRRCSSGRTSAAPPISSSRVESRFDAARRDRLRRCRLQPRRLRQAEHRRRVALGRRAPTHCSWSTPASRSASNINHEQFPEDQGAVDAARLAAPVRRRRAHRAHVPPRPTGSR